VPTFFLSPVQTKKMKNYKTIITSQWELNISPCISTGGIPLFKKEDLKGCYISHPIQEIPEWIKVHIDAGHWVEIEVSVYDTGRKTKKGNPVYKVDYVGCKKINKDWTPYLEDIREGKVDGENCVYLYVQESSKIKNSTRWSEIKISGFKSLPERLQPQAKAMLEAFEWNKNNPEHNLREEVVNVDPTKYVVTSLGSSRYVKVSEGVVKRYATRVKAELLNGEWGVNKEKIRVEYKCISVKLAPYPNPSNLYCLTETCSEESMHIPIELWSLVLKEEFVEKKEISYQTSKYKFDFWDKFENERGHFETEWKKKWVDVYKITASLPENLYKHYEEKGILPLEINYLIYKNV
jgi:hypothetical protein